MRRAGWVPVFLCLALRASAAEAVLVEPGRYAETAERLIDAAKKDVRLALYLFSYFPQQSGNGPGRLAEALVRARRRGVRVEVLLDPGREEKGKNLAAEVFLRRGGVDVAYADGPVLHAKALIVDGEAVLAGSSNWSAAAFTRNLEADFLVRSTAAAQALLRRFAAAPREPSPAPEETLAAPAALLAPDLLGEMVTRNDHRAFDAYLYFLHIGLSTETYRTVEREALQEALGLKPSVRGHPQLSDLLKRMRDRYGLIDFTKQGKGEPEVRLRPLPTEGAVRLPAAYFRHGWDRRLPPPARMFALLSLKESRDSPTAPKWSLGREALAERYGVGTWAVGKGAVELRRLDLLEVEHSEIPLDGGPRRPNIYTPNPFYDPGERAARLASLEKAYGPAAAARARKLAALVYEDQDAGLMERLAALEAAHGTAVLAEAARVLGNKSPDNPKRNGGYLIGTIERMAENHRAEQK